MPTLAINQGLLGMISKLEVSPYFSDYPFNRLIGLRQTRDIRNMIEGLLLSVVPRGAIVEMVNRRFGNRMPAMITELDLEIYRTFFFDLMGVDTQSLMTLLQDCDSVESKIKLQALQDPEDVDRLKWMLGLPVLPDPLVALSKLTTSTYYRLQDILKAPTLDTSQINALNGALMRYMDRQKKWQIGADAHTAGQITTRILEVQALNSRAAPIVTTLPELKPQGNIRALPALPSAEGKK